MGINMKVVALLTLVMFAYSHDFPENDDVITLTDENFYNALEEFSSGLLVKFYAPWCGHCKTLAPQYSKAARILKNQDPPIFIAELDATVATQVAGSQGVKGYPTLKFFKDKNAIEYSGGKTDKEIVNWINKKMGPAIAKQVDHAQLQQYLDKQPLSVVFFGDESSSNYKVFENVCNGLGDMTCASVDSEAAAKQYEAELNNFVLFKPFDEGKNVYKGKYVESEINKFISSNSIPTVSEFDQKLAQLIFTEGNPGLFLFRENNDRAYDEILKEVATNFKGTLYCTYTQISNGLGKRLSDLVGIKADNLPSIWIIQAAPGQKDMKKFQMSGEVSKANINKFVEQYKKGDLKALFKTKDIPTEPLENGVRVLVGKNFQEVAFDESKDVLVKFYAPWCGHCKKLAPEYEQVAQELAHVESLIIAKLDATDNEVEGVSIQGFPTLKFFPAGSKRMVDYNGQRDAAGIKNWLKSQVTNKFKFKEEL